MKKKVLSMMLVGVLAVSAFAACGSNGASNAATGSTDGEETTVDTASEDENTLSVAAWDKNFNIPALEAAEKAYQKKNPDFKLIIQEQSQSSDVEDKVTLAGSSDDYSQLPDIVLFQDHYIKKYVTDYPNAWQSLEDADINWDDFGAEKLSYSTIDGKHYGAPVDNGTVIMAYRTDALEQAGYTVEDMKGISWDQFDEIGKAVYEKTGLYLLSMDGDGNDLPYMMLQAEGVSQFADGKPQLDSNQTVADVINVIVKLAQDNVLYLANDWSDYTDNTIVADKVAGVMNGNWIIPTMEKVEANSGKWEITTMPTLTGEEGYASNGGSSLYITANCKKTDLAKDFLAYTFGGSTATYDKALTDGGVISCYAPAGESEVYNQGVAFFNDQPIYSTIVEMGTHVQPVEQSDYHYTCRTQIAAAIINIINGGNIDDELQLAEDQLNHEMGN